MKLQEIFLISETSSGVSHYPLCVEEEVANGLVSWSVVIIGHYGSGSIGMSGMTMVVEMESAHRP